MTSRARCIISLVLTLTASFACFAAAPPWPTKPIRLVVNFPPGGTTDQMARALGPRLAETFGQPVVIDNRGGAGGNIGLEVVAKSAPNGYTLLISSGSPITVGPHLYRLGFDVSKALAPVAPTARTPILLVVQPGLPIRTFAELLAHARAHPGKLTFGSAGNGTTLHIHGERLLRTAKIQATHVPYKGVAPMIVALLGGQIDFAFDSGLTIQHVKAEKLRLLAVLSPARSPLFPDTPTLAEMGTVVDPEPLFGVYAPAGTPHEIIMRLNREITRIMQTAEVRAALATFGSEVVTASPEEFAAIQRRDRERQGAFIREANIRLD
ncbi:MAG TPA: tripartite tricarboxylate transporter substrate binding protein [Burkholderiales bacterium]|nr:tripartite tricarboxylate transporter substrate binding protein [Burkholderiales bacterium]